MPDGQSMVFGKNWPKINGFKSAFNQLGTIQGAMLDYNSLIKPLRCRKKIPSKSAKIGKKPDGQPMVYGQNWSEINDSK